MPPLSVVIGMALLCGVALIYLHESGYDWHLRPVIRRSRRNVLEVVRRRYPDARIFTREGATRINPRHLPFWIGTSTDEQRNQLRQDPSLIFELREALIRAGYPANAV